MSKYENKEGMTIFCVCKYIICRGLGAYILPQEIFTFYYFWCKLRREFHANYCTVLPQTVYFQCDQSSSWDRSTSILYTFEPSATELQRPGALPITSLFQHWNTIFELLTPTRLGMTGCWTINISRIFTAVPTNAHPNYILARSFLPGNNNTWALIGLRKW